jgi:hypothetical protein
MKQRVDLLGMVHVGEKVLRETLSRAELLQLAEAMEQERFAAQVSGRLMGH